MRMKQILRTALNILMTLLTGLLMAYHLTGSALHEWVGTAVFVLFLLHHYLNRHWYKGLFKGRYSAPRILITVVDFLLLIDMACIFYSGVMLSREVFGFLQLRAGMLGRRLHLVSTAWGFLLAAAHLGLHWGTAIRFVSKRLRPTRWMGIAAKALALLLSLYGVYALISRQIVDRLFLLTEYAFFDYSEPGLFFFADYACIFILFATPAYYLTRLFRKMIKGETM